MIFLFYIGVVENSLQPTEDSSKRKAWKVKGEDISCKLEIHRNNNNNNKRPYLCEQPYKVDGLISIW